MTLKKGTIKRIHVNKHKIARYLKTGEMDPPITVQTSKGPLPGDRVNIVVGGRVVASVVTSFEKPLSCGARIWIETKEEVEIS